MAVVVGYRRLGIERLQEREVQLTSISLARVALAHVVEEVPDRLVGDEQPQKPSISTIRQKGLDQVTPGVKSLNYLANILARAEASASGAQEAILLNVTGHVSECSGDNLFYVKNGKIFTPPELMQIDPRPSRVTDPSASTVAKSPGITNFFPSTVMNTSALFTGSL